MNDKDIKKLVQEELKGETPKTEEPKVEVKLTSEELADKIGEKIADAILQAKEVEGEGEKDELKEKLFNTDNGLQAIKYPELKDLGGLSDDEKIVTFFKSLLMRDKDIESDKVFKALVEGTSADGGYLVPAPLATEIWRVLPDISVMRRIARTMPMTSHTLALNSLTARPQSYWISEYASKTTTSAEFSQVTLTANKLVALLPITHELIADANIDIVRFIIDLFAEEIGRTEDKAFFTGSGTGQPRGINQETLTNQSAGASLDFDDMIDLIDLVPQAVSQASSAAFVGNRFVKRLLRKIKDNDGGYIWRNGAGRVSGQVERLPDTVYGYPFYEQNDLSQDELYFGDWNYYIIGDRQQITVSTTDEGGDAWRRDATEIKAVERVDGRVVLTSPFAKLIDV